MQAGHKHRDLSAEGDALQHVAVQSGMDCKGGSADRLAVGEQGAQRYMLTGCT